MIDRRHELCRLTDLIEWHSFDGMFVELYCAGHKPRLILRHSRIFCLRLLATPAGMKLGTRQVMHPSKPVTRLSSRVARIALPSVDPQFGGGGGKNRVLKGRLSNEVVLL